MSIEFLRLFGGAPDNHNFELLRARRQVLGARIHVLLGAAKTDYFPLTFSIS